MFSSSPLLLVTLDLAPSPFTPSLPFSPFPSTEHVNPFSYEIRCLSFNFRTQITLTVLMCFSKDKWFSFIFVMPLETGGGKLETSFFFFSF